MSDPVRAALAEGTAPQLLAVAAHEVGHGIAWRVAGFPVGAIRINRGWFGGVAGASCEHNARGRVTEANLAGFLVGYAAGITAQQRCAQLYLRGRHGSGGDGHDRNEFEWMQRNLLRRDRISYHTATQRAVRLLAAHGDRLDALTAQLARTGRLHRP